MRIQVTRACIKKGRRGDTNECPVALALTEAGVTDVWVDIESIRYEDTYEIKTPRSVARFVKAFDHGKKVKPFAFNFTF